MDYSSPTLLVISGPNGSGKSTHIQIMLPDSFEGIFSFDRDQTRVTFEQELRKKGIQKSEIAVQAPNDGGKAFRRNEKSYIKQRSFRSGDTTITS